MYENATEVPAARLALSLIDSVGSTPRAITTNLLPSRAKFSELSSGCEIHQHILFIETSSQSDSDQIYTKN